MLHQWNIKLTLYGNVDNPTSRNILYSLFTISKNYTTYTENLLYINYYSSRLQPLHEAIWIYEISAEACLEMYPGLQETWYSVLN
jgi:hypothetical protein